MTFTRTFVSAGVALALVVPPVAASANTPSGLGDLVGARGSSGEGELHARGWETTDKTGTTSSGRYTYWWNSSSKDCIRVMTEDGRYAAIDSASRKDCGKNNDGTAIAAAVGAAAVIGAIALATSGKHKDNQSTSYTRGYNDGYAARRYSGSGQDYSEGYGAGMRARNGYASNPGYNNGGYYGGGWQGLRGRDNDFADSQLRNMGYYMVGKDSLSSGHERMYYQSSSRTCLRVRTESGNFREIDKVNRRYCR